MPPNFAQSHTAIVIGAPRFARAALTERHTADGALAAWQQAYSEFGVRAAEQVSGDFAVALNTPTGGAYLAIDRFAIHSLCYRVQDGRLRWATRADQLADSSTQIDPQAIYDYVFLHVIPSPRTIYQGIYRLPPGHHASFENGHLTVARSWTPRFDEQASPNFGALREEFLHIVKNAVAERIPTHGKTGCFLSGGTDSSTVAGMMREVTGHGAASYSIGFEAEGYDEMAYARIAAKRFGCDHHEYYVTPADLVRSIGDVAGHYDQPFGNSSAVPAFYCAMRAKQDGITHLLAGDGGDELFSGNTRYAKERVFGWYEQLPAGLRNGLLEPLLDNDSARAIPGIQKASSYVTQARVPMPDRMQTYNQLTRLGASEVLTPALLALVDQDEPRRLQRGVWDEVTQGGLVNRMLAFDWRYTLAENDLPKVIGTTALAGVTVGFPLLDTKLLDFSLKLPTAYKLKGFKLRWFFKEALRGFLPDEILTKKKQGFGLPFGVWAVRDPALYALAAESLRSIADRGIVNSAFVESLLTHRLKEHAGYYGEMVWILMMLEQWLRVHAPEFRV